MRQTGEDTPPSSWMERLLEHKAALYAIGLFLTLILAVLSVTQPDIIQTADQKLYDQLVSGRVRPPQSATPVLVGIDEESLAELGQWPWPRYRIALLLTQLKRLGAKSVALDFLMPEPDRSSPEVIQMERQRDLQGVVNPAGPIDQDSNSQQLASALHDTHTVLGYFLDYERLSAPNRQQQPPAIPTGTVLIRSQGISLSVPPPKGVVRSLPVLTHAAYAEGFTNALLDNDGTLRRVPVLLSAEGQIHPSLALATLLSASTERKLKLTKDANGIVLQWDHRHIPLDARGNMMLDYRTDTYPYYPAATILKGGLAPGALQDKIVFIGSWASGLNDMHLTPSGKLVNGLVIHAMVVDNILSNTFISRPDWSKGVELFLVLAAGLFCTWLLSRAGFVMSVLTVLLGTTGFYAVSHLLLIKEGVYLSPLMPMMAFIVITAVLSLWKYEIEAHKVRVRTKELAAAQDEIIVSMSVMAEARDKETGGHIHRTQRYVETLARQLASTPKYAHLTEFDILLLGKSAPLHDIGKIGIPDSILQKPGKLTPEEYAIMQTHTQIGAESLAKVMNGSGNPDKQSFLNYARDMTLCHHERWDGNGYPQKLKGEDIPLAGRLMALADVYDALISERVYKKGFPPEKVREFIIENGGSHFDPAVVDAFLAREAEFLQIYKQFADVA
ncbi:CHASE2 domain-containing protein [Leeia oryzae]|uniref:CHASE2 domain-containing protein n=1 Tax=Leeia oryzae TaxID=356662 RepID=UPI0003A95DA7|nr:CHASE2 domain-containing protein [Leeia oryzae]